MGARVALAEDEVLLREGIARLLGEAGHEVVGQAGDVEALNDVVREHVPDLVIVDIRMPPTQTAEGLDAARTIRAEFPQIGILLLSAHVDVGTAMDLLKDGEGVGYLLKSRVMNVADFLEAIDRVLAGGCVVDPALVQALLAEQRRHDPLAELTPREREVLALMAEGRSNAGIAHRLWVTEGAVEKHVRGILMKLDLHSTEEDHRRVLAVVTYLDAR
jgi:DNA-binding NarL/FixJ family response regulator